MTCTWSTSLISSTSSVHLLWLKQSTNKCFFSTKIPNKFPLYSCGSMWYKCTYFILHIQGVMRAHCPFNVIWSRKYWWKTINNMITTEPLKIHCTISTMAVAGLVLSGPGHQLVQWHQHLCGIYIYIYYIYIQSQQYEWTWDLMVIFV